MVSSTTNGTVLSVDDTGSASSFSNADSAQVLVSSYGLQVDATRSYLYVVNNKAPYPSSSTSGSLVVLNLSNGSFVKEIVFPNSFGNIVQYRDVSPADLNGYVYVTEAYGGSILQVSISAGTARQFFQSTLLKPSDSSGLGADGLDLGTFHNGSQFLLISKTGIVENSPGLFRLLLSNSLLTKVSLDITGLGFYGVSFDTATTQPVNIYVVGTNRVYRYSSGHQWNRATLIQAYDITCLTPVTVYYYSSDDRIFTLCSENFSSGPYFIERSKISPSGNSANASPTPIPTIVNVSVASSLSQSLAVVATLALAVIALL